jgi:hypothetical protein
MLNLPAKPAGLNCAGHHSQPEARRNPEQATLSSSHDVGNLVNNLLDTCSVSNPERWRKLGTRTS